MKWVYVCHRPLPPDGNRGVRPPDEMHVVDAARRRGVEVHTTHYGAGPGVAAMVKEVRPDLVLYSHPPRDVSDLAGEVKREKGKACLAFLSFDYAGYEGDPSRESRFHSLMPHVDVVLSKDGAPKNGPVAVHARRVIQGYHPEMRGAWSYPRSNGHVVFMGAYSSRRDEILAYLQRQLGPRVRVYSQTGGWKQTGKVYGRVFGEAKREAIHNCTCVLDITDGPGVPGYHSDRVEDALAAGAPLLMEWVPKMERDLVGGTHVLYWKTMGDIIRLVARLDTEKGLAERLSGHGKKRAEWYSYDQLVSDVINACREEMGFCGRSMVSVETEPLKRKHVTVFGQWRPQGLGYMARRIVDVVEGCGGEVRVASINGNPEWSPLHRWERHDVPPANAEAIVFLEKAHDKWLDWAKQRGALTVYLPMWEFFRPRPEIEWAKRMDVVAGIPHEALGEACGRPVDRLPWDPGILPYRPLHCNDPVTFFHDARGLEQGKYDMRPRQRTELVLQAFRAARTRVPMKLIVRTRTNPMGLREEGIEEVSGEMVRADLFELIRTCDVALCPSAPEGLGLPYAEFQALAVVPVALNVLPVNAFIAHGRDGLLLTPVDCGPRGLARDWYPDVHQLEDFIVHLASQPKRVMLLKDGCVKTAEDRFGSFAKYLIDVLNR